MLNIICFYTYFNESLNLCTKWNHCYQNLIVFFIWIFTANKCIEVQKNLSRSCLINLDHNLNKFTRRYPYRFYISHWFYAVNWYLVVIWYSGHFLLTNLLLKNMKETAIRSNIKGRIVILTSSYHKYAYPEGIRFDKINSSEG